MPGLLRYQLVVRELSAAHGASKGCDVKSFMKLINWCAPIVFLFLSFHGLARASDPATIEAARKEGSVMIYNSMTPSQMQLIINAFQAKYPFIQVKVYRAVGERLLTKILTEAQAGQHDFDILQSGDT